MLNKFRLSSNFYFGNSMTIGRNNRVKFILVFIIVLFLITTITNYNQIVNNSVGSRNNNDIEEEIYDKLKNSKLLDPDSIKKGFDIHNEVDTSTIFSTVAQVQFLKRYQKEIDDRVDKFRQLHYNGIGVRSVSKSHQERREKFKNKEPNPDFIQGMYKHFEIEPNFLQSKVSNHYSMKSNNSDKKFNISIVTQATVDRLDKVKLMAEKWLAPLSVSVYIKGDNREKDISILEEYVENCLVLQEFADFHLFFANNTWYPVNNLRNLAIKHALTDYVFVMDADFLPPLGLHDYINNHIATTLLNPPKLLDQKQRPPQEYLDNVNLNSTTNISMGFNNEKNHEKYAFVVPSFSSSIQPRYHPDDKLKLTELVYYQLVSPSNLDQCWKCHSPTDFSNWFRTNEPYAIKYNWLYEPYLVYNRSEAIPFDERLKGYGFDKNAHAFGLAVSGYNFIVLPHAFIIHVNHPSASWSGPSHYEQQWNALRVVCEMIKELKLKHNYPLDKSIFNEPVGTGVSGSGIECLSDLHW